MGFLGIVLVCANVQATSCMFTTSTFLFDDYDDCMYQANNIAESFSKGGSYAFYHCAEVEENGEML